MVLVLLSHFSFTLIFCHLTKERHTSHSLGHIVPDPKMSWMPKEQVEVFFFLQAFLYKGLHNFSEFLFFSILIYKRSSKEVLKTSLPNKFVTPENMMVLGSKCFIPSII